MVSSGIQLWDLVVPLCSEILRSGEHSAIPSVLNAVLVFLLLAAGYGDEHAHLQIHHCPAKLRLIFLAKTAQGLNLMERHITVVRTMSLIRFKLVQLLFSQGAEKLLVYQICKNPTEAFSNTGVVLWSQMAVQPICRGESRRVNEVFL